MSWRMVRHVQRNLSTELCEQDVEIIRGCLQTALRREPPLVPKRKPSTTAREDRERKKNLRPR